MITKQSSKTSDVLMGSPPFRRSEDKKLPSVKKGRPLLSGSADVRITQNVVKGKCEPREPLGECGFTGQHQRVKAALVDDVHFPVLT